MEHLLKNNKYSLPDSFSNEWLKVFFGRNLTQKSTVVAGENSISMPGISKARKQAQ